MGDLLISGSGRGCGSKYPSLLVLICIVLLLLGIIFMNIRTYDYDQKETNSAFGITFCVLGVLSFLIASWWPSAKRKTFINVYEHGIDGGAVTTSSFSIQEFSVTYDQILNVDKSENMIIIFTSYERFKCYSKKYEQIYECIEYQRTYESVLNSKKLVQETKFCSNCGVQLDPNSKFCNNCGTKL